MWPNYNSNLAVRIALCNLCMCTSLKSPSQKMYDKKGYVEKSTHTTLIHARIIMGHFLLQLVLIVANFAQISVTSLLKLAILYGHEHLIASLPKWAFVAIVDVVKIGEGVKVGDVVVDNHDAASNFRSWVLARLAYSSGLLIQCAPH